MIAEPITTFLQERIDAGDFPSAVYLVAEKGEIVFQDALGFAVVEPERIPARLDTIYDLASLTKPLVTGLVRAKLIDSERSAVDEVIALNAKHRSPTIRALATHTTGFPAWRPLYLEVKDQEEVFDWILRSEFESDGMVTYSDLNFILLGLMIERYLGQRLDLVFRRFIGKPLGLSVTGYAGEFEARDNIAASEKGNEYERLTCTEHGYLGPDSKRSAFFRNGVIWGEVHDGNAYFMQGVAGHAGLFSTAEEVFKIALQFLPNYTTILKADATELFRTNYTKGLNEDRSFAFQLASTKDSTAGAKMPPESLGHTGFTGTSLWIDPINERVFVLLTNRTHAHSLPFVNINSVRRRFHDLAIDLLDKK
jgi:CubicO group peptidase (beta-lactamase class C family)